MEIPQKCLGCAEAAFYLDEIKEGEAGRKIIIANSLRHLQIRADIDTPDEDGQSFIDLQQAAGDLPYFLSEEFEVPIEAEQRIEKLETLDAEAADNGEVAFRFTEKRIKTAGESLNMLLASCNRGQRKQCKLIGRPTDKCGSSAIDAAFKHYETLTANT
jgi:hypothetical protein